MVDQVQVKPITLEDVIAMEEEDKLIEISDGQWESQTMASPEHGEIWGEIFGELRNFLKTNNLGQVYGPDTSFVLEGTPGNIVLMRLPDVAFVAQGRLKDREGGYYFTVPDIAVEVISSSERPGKVAKKLDEYLRTGVKQVWLVYPESQEVIVHSAQGLNVYGIEDTIPGGELLPEFSLPVKTIFSRVISS